MRAPVPILKDAVPGDMEAGRGGCTHVTGPDQLGDKRGGELMKPALGGEPPEAPGAVQVRRLLFSERFALNQSPSAHVFIPSTGK